MVMFRVAEAPSRLRQPQRPLSYRARSAEHVLIDDVLADRFPVERAQEVARGLFAHAVDRLPGNACDMRRNDHVGKLEQRVGHAWRLLLENIKARASELARRERVVK